MYTLYTFSERNYFECRKNPQILFLQTNKGNQTKTETKSTIYTHIHAYRHNCKGNNNKKKVQWICLHTNDFRHKQKPIFESWAIFGCILFAFLCAFSINIIELLLFFFLCSPHCLFFLLLAFIVTAKCMHI